MIDTNYASPVSFFKVERNDIFDHSGFFILPHIIQFSVRDSMLHRIKTLKNSWSKQTKQMKCSLTVSKTIVPKKFLRMNIAFTN